MGRTEYEIHQTFPSLLIRILTSKLLIPLKLPGPLRSMNPLPRKTTVSRTNTFQNTHISASGRKLDIRHSTVAFLCSVTCVLALKFRTSSKSDFLVCSTIPGKRTFFHSNSRRNRAVAKVPRLYCT